MQPCLRIGLTGGIGSGKSTVAQMLEDLGATIIDADAIARATTAAGGAAIAPIRTTFGAQFISAEGGLDRDRMRELAFSEPEAKKRLESIVHPLVGQAIESQFKAAQSAGARCVVFDIPLLVESDNWHDRLDKILVVDCLEDTQIARVRARNGLDEATVHKIIQAQASRAERLAIADLVIFNDGLTLEQLRDEVLKVAHHFGL